MAAEKPIKSSSNEMDLLTQINWELTVEIAGQLAAFLYDRDAICWGLPPYNPECLDTYRQKNTACYYPC